jgi:predicted GIY-YIG superfamily endonuclease
MIGYVYTLACEKGNIFYVGATNNLESRLYSHNQLALSGSQRKAYAFIRKNKIKVVLEVIEEVQYNDRKELLRCEMFWIDQIRSWGFTLTNWRGMPRIKPEPKQVYNIRMPKRLVDRIREYKKKHGGSIGGFVEIAAIEKLKKINKVGI